MERPGISADDLYSHHANFIVRFFPVQAVDLFQDFGHQDKIAACVRKRCRELGRTYEEIMDLAHNRQWDEIQRIKMNSDLSSAQLSQSRDNSLPSTPLPPTINFPNPGFTNRNPPSPAPTASTSKSHAHAHAQISSPPEFITVIGKVSTTLTMHPSSDGLNHIRPEVAERLGLLGPDPVSPTYPSAGYNRPPDLGSVQLSFVRQVSDSNKSHWLRFFLDDALEKADVLVNYQAFQPRPKTSPNYVPGGPPPNQPPRFPQMSHTTEHDPFRTANDGYPPPPSSYHASTETTARSPGHPAGFDVHMHPMRSSPLPGHGSNSPIQQPPGSVIFHPQPSRVSMNNTSNVSQESHPAGINDNKVTGIYSGGSGQHTFKRTFVLCPTGDSFLQTSQKVCQSLRIKFDRPALLVDFVSTADQSSCPVALDDETFQDDWSAALEFLQEKRSGANPGPDFMIKIERLDDGG